MKPLPKNLVKDLKAEKVNLDDPATTLVLLKNNAVVGLTGFFDEKGNLSSVGTQCALCHSTVDDSFAPGIGKRLDGWANRDLNVGAIISLAPNLKVIAERLGVDLATVKKVLASWGPGKFDAVLLEDGIGFRPDGKPAATLLPPTFALSGFNLHTWTGWGSVTYWNAYVANTQMRGKGTFYDPRLNNPNKYPIAVKTGDWNIRNKPDLSHQNWQISMYISWHLLLPKLQRIVMIKRQHNVEKSYLAERLCVPDVMYHPYIVNQDGQCILQKKWELTLSKPKGLLTIDIGLHH